MLKKFPSAGGCAVPASAPNIKVDPGKELGAANEVGAVKVGVVVAPKVGGVVAPKVGVEEVAPKAKSLDDVLTGLSFVADALNVKSNPPDELVEVFVGGASTLGALKLKPKPVDEVVEGAGVDALNPPKIEVPELVGAGAEGNKEVLLVCAPNTKLLLTSAGFSVDCPKTWKLEGVEAVEVGVRPKLNGLVPNVGAVVGEDS